MRRKAECVGGCKTLSFQVRNLEQSKTRKEERKRKKEIHPTEKLEPLTDGFTHFQLILKTMNTRTQYTSANITLPPQEHFVSAQNRHVDTAIQNAILKKGALAEPVCV